MNGIWFSNSTQVQSGFHVRFQGWMEAEGTCFKQSNTENISGIERNAVGMYVWYLRYINREHQYTQQGSANLWTLFEDPKTFWQTKCLVNKWQEQERTGKNQRVDLNRLPHQNPEKWPWQPLYSIKSLLQALPCEANLLAGQQLSVSCHCDTFKKGTPNLSESRIVPGRGEKMNFNSFSGAKGFCLQVS